MVVIGQPGDLISRKTTRYPRGPVDVHQRAAARGGAS
jgi:hypothetical protein